MSTGRFVEELFNDGIMGIVSLRTYLTSRYIVPDYPSSSHRNFCHLAKIRKLGSCENLRSRYISIHTIEPYILWEHSLKFCHQWYKRCVIIWNELSTFPHISELRVRSNHHRVYLEFIRTIVRIGKNLLHRRFVSFWSGTNKSWHHMSYHLESCIFEKSGCTY